MAKKNIKTVLKTKEKETIHTSSALILKNCIKYLENDCKMVIDIRKDYVTMVRKNDEYEIYFHFELGNCHGRITLPFKGTVELDVTLESLQQTENTISIVYILNDEKYEYDIYY